MDADKEQTQLICYEIGLENFEKGLNNQGNEHFETTIYAINIALAINPVFYNGIFLRGLSRYMLHKYSLALKDFKISLSNSDCKDDDIRVFREKCKINNSYELKLYLLDKISRKIRTKKLVMSACILGLVTIIAVGIRFIA